MPGDTEPYLLLDKLEKRYDKGVTAVAALSLAVAKGELVGLLGPSGCGKTTSLRMIGGLTPVTSGRILVGGVDVTHVLSYRRDMGIVFQSYALFPHMSVEQNVAFGLEMRKMPRTRIKQRVHQVLDLVHLGHLAERRPTTLSGGQQQRVALARALAIEPNILLLDEPLSNLDAKLRETLRAEIRDLQRRLQITSVFVTHDQVEALAICDRVAVMRDGRVEQFGTPAEVYETPQTAYVAEFVGHINKFKGARRASGEIDLGPTRIGSATPGEAGPVTIMVRPHHISLGKAGSAPSPDSNHCAGVISDVTYLGDVLSYAVDIGPGLVAVETTPNGDTYMPSRGENVSLSWRREHTLVFAEADADG